MSQLSLPLLLLFSSFIPAIIIFFLPNHKEKFRNFLNLTGIFFKILIVSFLLYGVSLGNEYYFSFEMFEGIDFVLKADSLSLLFAALSSILWLFTTLYAISYLKNDTHKSLFFGFFCLCVTATVGLALAGNLFTFLIFYEFLTLTTFALVLHERTHAAKLAAISYIKYTVTGGVFLLIGVVGLYFVAGNAEFVNGGYLQSLESPDIVLQLLFIILLIGVGVKAAIFPLHGWLPKAMAAPAPVSALLHAVAVVKAGAFGIIRIVYDVYGIDLAYDLGLLFVLMVVALTTILYGSIKALTQTQLKKRLAYSTVSQVSYIALGVSLFGPLGSIGGIVHLVHQGMMKITLFFCAGSFAKTYGVTEISQMNGLGQKMPLTSFAFSVGALGMIGIPPIAGFVSKWYLGLGAMENGLWVVMAAIGVSALLNAIYFLPLLYRIWFLPPHHLEAKIVEKHGFESRLFLFLPPLVIAIISLMLGIFALSSFSALHWVEHIVYMEYIR